MISKILVPLDGTSVAEKALPYAIRLAEQYQATILLKRVVFVNHLLNGELLPGKPLENAETVAEGESEAYLDKVKKLISNPQSKTHLAADRVQILVESGKPIETISELLEVEKVDFVVMTTHGRTGFGEIVLGSTAAGVVQHSSVPVMLIRPDHHVAHPQPEPTLADMMNNPAPMCLERNPDEGHLLVALDGYEYAEKALEIATEISKAYSATVHLLDVLAPPLAVGVGHSDFGVEMLQGSLVESHAEAYQYLAKLQAHLIEQGLACVKVVLDGNPPDEIADYANQIHAMCIVMATHSPGRVTQAFLSSTAQEVLRRTQLPVVMVHPTAQAEATLSQIPATTHVTAR